MFHKSGIFFWAILITFNSGITIVLTANVAYPDSYEMYAYKQPRTMNDLKNQHMRQAMIDVKETINEVQKILQKDPKLPRLTRGEIEDLFEMVTREEYKRSLAAGDYQRAKHMRSLMLVLPFNTNNYSEERLEELFTRTPVTKMVDNNVAGIPKPSQRIVIPAAQDSPLADMMGAPSLVMNQQMPTTFKPNFPVNMKTMYTAPVTTFHPKGNVQMITTLYPQPTGFFSQTPGQMIMTNYYPRTTMQTIPTFYSKAGAVPLTTAYNPNVNPMSTFHPKTTAQTISTYHPKAAMQTVPINAIPTTYISTYHPKATTHKMTPVSIQHPFMTMALPHKYNNRFTAPTIDGTMRPVTPSIRPNVQNLLATIGLEPDSNAMEINNQMSDLQQSSSTQVEVTTNNTTTRTTIAPTAKTTISTTRKPVLTPELKELLVSFGLLKNEEPQGQIAAPIEDEFHPASSSSLKDESLSVNEFKPLPKSVTASDIEDKIDSSFETKSDNFMSFKPLPLKESAPTKDEELDSLLKSYGILEDDPASKTIQFDNENDFDSQESESETIEVTEKIKPMSQIPDVDVGFLSPDLTRILGNIGIKNVNKNQVKSATLTSNRRFDKQKSTTTAQAFSSNAGTVPSSTMENDYQKLHILLDTIKELDNLTANLTDEELEKLNLRNFNLSQDALTESAGPENFGIENEVKNEVKREINSSEPTRIQLDITGTTASPNPTATHDLNLSLDNDKSDDTITTPTTTTTTTSTETLERKAKQENLDSDDSDPGKTSEKDADRESSTTESPKEETKNGSIGDLAGSFGGNDGLDPVSEEPLPPPRKNGFYFFSDWNSFLEVGLDDSDKVIVRFDPKDLRDQSQFIPVKIP